MSYLLQKEYVRYECSCGTFAAIPKLYFCRHCLQLRCGYCVCHEVDSHYCSNCMENLPSAEAKMKKNRCGTCFDCPNCFHTLSVRATMKSAEDGNIKAPTKHYYLACFFCRWTTRDVGIQDQTVVGNWPLKDHPYSELLTSYLDFFKIVAMRERSLKEKKSFGSHRRGYTSFTEKFGLTSMIARKRAGLPSLPLTNKDLNQASLPLITPCEAQEEVEPLSESYFTEIPDLTKISNIAQRHANPILQPTWASELHPQHTHFHIKISHRCRVCEHNVSKPEYNPGSIKFKIQLSAFYHMPEVRIVTFDSLKSGSRSEIILKFTNPTQHMLTLTFSPFKESNKFKSLKEDEKEISNIERPICKIKRNAVVNLPECSIILPQRDDAAEYDEIADSQHFQDDPKIVVWRRGNKAAIKFIISPDPSLAKGTEVFFNFCFEYTYINNIPTVEPKQSTRSEIQVNLYVNPGRITA